MQYRLMTEIHAENEIMRIINFIVNKIFKKLGYSVCITKNTESTYFSEIIYKKYPIDSLHNKKFFTRGT